MTPEIEMHVAYSIAVVVSGLAGALIVAFRKSDTLDAYLRNAARWEAKARIAEHELKQAKRIIAEYEGERQAAKPEVWQ